MTFLILTGVIVGAVWGAIFALRGSLVLGSVLYLAMASCLGAYFWSFDLAGVTFTLDRLFLLGVLGAFVVQWRLGRLEPKRLVGADWLLLGFVGWITVSALTHDWRSDQVGQVPVIQHLINGYYIPLALYFVARNLFFRERQVNQFQAALVVFGAYLAVVGLLEAVQAWSLIWPRYIANPELGLHFGRSRGPMVHSVSYGVYLSTCMICVWLWRERLPRQVSLMLLLLLPAFLGAIFFTKTRTVWLAAGTSVFLTLAFTLRGRLRVLTLGAMVACALIVGVCKMDSILGLQREGTVADTRQSASMRKSFTYVSWLMFRDRPIAGFGFGQFASAKLPYLSDRSVDLQLESIRAYVHHNTFLSILTETGLVGLGLFLAVFFHWAKIAWRLLRQDDAPNWMRRQALLFLGVCCIAFWQMVGHEITFTPLDMSLIFLVAGIAVSLAQINEATPTIAWTNQRQASTSKYVFSSATTAGRRYIP